VAPGQFRLDLRHTRYSSCIRAPARRNCQREPLRAPSPAQTDCLSRLPGQGRPCLRPIAPIRSRHPTRPSGPPRRNTPASADMIVGGHLSSDGPQASEPGQEEYPAQAGQKRIRRRASRSAPSGGPTTTTANQTTMARRVRGPSRRGRTLRRASREAPSQFADLLNQVARGPVDARGIDRDRARVVLSRR